LTLRAAIAVPSSLDACGAQLSEDLRGMVPRAIVLAAQLVDRRDLRSR